MKNNYWMIIVINLIVIIIFILIPISVKAFELSDGSFNANDDVKLIIEFENEPLVSYKKNVDNYENTITEGIYELFNGKEKTKGLKISNQNEKIEKEHKNLLKDLKVSKAKREYKDLMNGVAITIKGKDFDKIKNMKGVKNVWVDGEVHTLLDDSVPLINANQVWNKTDFTGINNITGSGVIVAIIDTGIAYTHSDLGNCTTAEFLAGTCVRIPYGYDFVNDDADPYDDNGHGTHCAGIVGANGNIKGVAPNVTFLAYKVLGSSGLGSESDIISAIENATLYGSDIISLSLGGGGYSDGVFKSSIDNAVNNGILVVVAAGNNGANYNTVHSPGNVIESLTVGSTTKDDKISSFSSRGYVYYSNGSISGIKPDVVAPGSSINSTKINGYAVYSGTSMATPHVAGVAALIKQLHPDWNVSRIKAAIVNSAIDIGGDSNTQGSGRVDVLNAFNVTTSIIPTNYFFGAKVNFSIQVWNTSVIINITNYLTNSVSYNLTMDFNEEGISYLISNTSFDLNDSILINITFFVNESAEVRNYYPKLFLNYSNNLNLTVPFALIKSSVENPEGCPTAGTIITSNLTLPYNLTCTLPSLFTNYGIVIGSSNITLDCNYSTIRGLSTPVGIYIYPYSNITIKNCNIIDFIRGVYSPAPGSHFIKIINNTFLNNSMSINVYSSDNWNVTNNVAEGFSHSFLYAATTSSSEISNNIIHTESSGGSSITLHGNNNKIINNIINDTSCIDSECTNCLISYNNFTVRREVGSDGQGIIIKYSNSNYTDNIIDMGSEESVYGYIIASSNDNYIKKNIINYNNSISAGLWLEFSTDNLTIEDTIFSNSALDVWASENNYNNVVFINTTQQNGSNLRFSFYDDFINRTDVGWWVEINVSDGINIISNAETRFYNSLGEYKGLSMSNVNGIIKKGLAEYSVYNETSDFYYSNYTINATAYGYLPFITTINVSENKQLNIILSEDESPIVSLIVPPNNFIDNDVFIQLNCSTFNINDIKNISLYITDKYNLDFKLNFTNSSSSLDYFNVSLGLDEGNYTWNCESCTVAGDCAFSESNNSFIIDRIIPSFSDNKTNSNPLTINSSLVQFNLTLYDNINVDSYRFSHNDSHPFVANYCYQETANISTSCGLSTGKYSLYTDGEYYGIFAINYTIPSNAIGALWQVKHGNHNIYNISVPSSCFNTMSNIIQFEFYSSIVFSSKNRTYTYGSCFNDTNWINITYMNKTDYNGCDTDNLIDWSSNLFDGNWSSKAYYDFSESTWYYGTGDAECETAHIFEEAIWWEINDYDLSRNTWINESLVDINEPLITAIFNHTIENFPSTGGTMGWRVWANDSAGNVNISDIYTITVFDSNYIPPTALPKSLSFTGNSKLKLTDNGRITIK